MKKANQGDKTKLSAFNPGDRVRLLDSVLHEQFKGLTGTVKRVVKSRCCVTVLCDNGEEYGAFPQNVELIA